MTNLKVGYVIGNGLSRNGFDLGKLKDCVTVGCNSIHKDFLPTYLVALDEGSRGVARKLINKKYTKKNPRKWRYITREFMTDETNQTLKNMWWMTEEGEPLIQELFLNRGFCLNSGMYGALLLSQVKKFDVVYLIGMDFFRDVEDENGELQTNDVYSGEINKSHSGFIKVWNHMFDGAPTGRVEDGKVVKENAIHTKFIRVGPIEDSDREYYKNEHPKLECIESFDDMPIVKCEE
jgi:hypothetical protein